MTALIERALFAGVSLMLSAGIACAQGTVGGTVVKGNADTLFRAVVAQVRAKAYPIQAMDSVRRTLRFVHGDSPNEPIELRVSQRGDSTAFDARGVRGGIAALIFGLGVVRETLAARDSTAARAPAAPPPAPVKPPAANP